MPTKRQTTISTWVDPDDAPAWTPEVFARAEFRKGDKVIREATGTLTKRGRPKLDQPKKQVSLRLDQDILDRFRQDGPGWQSRINEALRRAVGT